MSHSFNMIHEQQRITKETQHHVQLQLMKSLLEECFYLFSISKPDSTTQRHPDIFSTFFTPFPEVLNHLLQSSWPLLRGEAPETVTELSERDLGGKERRCRKEIIGRPCRLKEGAAFVAQIVFLQDLSDLFFFQ